MVQQVHRLMTSAEHKMLAMLQFERGWLVDIDDASDRPVDEDAQTRQGELNELSEQCIPDMCLKLHELYFEMQDYKKVPVLFVFLCFLIPCFVQNAHTTSWVKCSLKCAEITLVKQTLQIKPFRLKNTYNLA